MRLNEVVDALFGFVFAVDDLKSGLGVVFALVEDEPPTKMCLVVHSERDYGTHTVGSPAGAQ